MICTDAEIAAITHRTRPTAQVRALRAMGIEHRVRGDGTVLLLKSHVEHLLGGSVAATVKSREPDWSAIK